jgi:hypothetical protein
MKTYILVISVLIISYRNILYAGNDCEKVINLIGKEAADYGDITTEEIVKKIENTKKSEYWCYLKNAKKYLEFCKSINSCKLGLKFKLDETYRKTQEFESSLYTYGSYTEAQKYFTDLSLQQYINLAKYVYGYYNNKHKEPPLINIWEDYVSFISIKELNRNDIEEVKYKTIQYLNEKERCKKIGERKTINYEDSIRCNYLDSATFKNYDFKRTKF